MISGCYDPGEIYLFPGKGGGTFGARQTICDKKGKPIIRVPKQTEAFESYGSWVAMVDWDGDGDLDIILGGFDGQMYLRLNEGTRTKPAYAEDNIVIHADGKPLKVNAHATPVVADWDGDGRWDLLSGSDDGGVYWWRNIGTDKEPKFAACQTLIAPHVGVGYQEFIGPGESYRPGIRSQICVGDWDGDGKLDLLVGDFCTYLKARSNLTNDEKHKVEEMRRKLDELSTEGRKRAEPIKKKLDAFWESIPKDQWLKPETQEKYQKLHKELYSEPHYKRLEDEVSKIRKQLTAYLEPPVFKTDFAPNESSHGFVWLYRRK